MAANHLRKNRDLWVIFAVALAVRLVVLWELSDGPAFAIPLYDEDAYQKLAVALLAGRNPGESLHWQPVFYPRFLSSFYELFGTSILAVQIFQALLDALAAALTGLFGRRLFGSTTGLIAGLIAALYGPAVFAATELLATSWAVFFTATLLLLFQSLEHEPRPRLWLLTGLVSGLAVLTRPLFLPFVIFGLGVLLFRCRRNLWRGPAVMVLGLSSVLGPASVDRAETTGSYSVLPISGSLNLFIGNSPDRCGALRTRGFAWERLVAEPFAGTSKPRARWTDTEAASYFFRRALHYFAREPLAAARDLAFKALELFHGPEVPRNGDVYVYRQWSLVLSTLLVKVGTLGLPFGLLLPFAIFGAIRQRKRIPWFMWLLLATFAAGIALVFVAGRYRTPLLPILAICSAAGGVSAWTTVAKRVAWSAVRWPAAAALLGFVVSLLPTARCEFDFDYEAELYQMVGTHFIAQGQPERAEHYLNEAVRRWPSYAEAHYNLGLLAAGRGNVERALLHFQTTLDTYPHYGPALRNSGLVLLRQGNAQQAHQRLVDAVRENAVSREELRTIGQQLLREGRAGDARLFLESAESR